MFLRPCQGGFHSLAWSRWLAPPAKFHRAFGTNESAETSGATDSEERMVSRLRDSVTGRLTERTDILRSLVGELVGTWFNEF